ncbi:MAG: hypothetical protein ACXAEU_10575 [Candidatus Hodarchaeales archaeon]
MVLDANWALFLENDQVIWKFGLTDLQSLELTLGFVKGLQNLGNDIFNENLVSILLERPDRARIPASEIFVANLEDHFFFVLCNPFETLRLIDFREALSEELHDQIRAILSGEAMVLYANLLSFVENDPVILKRIDVIFQRALTRVLNPKEDVTEYIGNGNCFLGSLSLESLISFHHNLRLRFMRQQGVVGSKYWGLGVNSESGKPLYELIHKVDVDVTLLAGYLSIFYNFLDELLGAKPQSISFGTSKLRNMFFFNGSNYFLVATNPDLLLNEENFHSMLLSLDKNVLNDFLPSIKRYLIEKILISEGRKLNKHPLDELIKIYKIPREKTQV